MNQIALPVLFFRGGTSRGPFFKLSDLPEGRHLIAQVLSAVIGSGHPLNIDGIGGGAAVTTKVAMLSKSDKPDVDIDYLFAQVSVEGGHVDFGPTCGNMLSGVGPAALEMGLVKASGEQTSIRIRAVNTNATIEAVIQTPGGFVTYSGTSKIDGVPGMSAPVLLNFMDVVGSSTGKFLPTGNLRDVIDGVEVTCMDVAIPVVIARASDFGLTGYESPEELDQNRSFYTRMESIRLAAGRLMGLGDVTASVTPKFVLIAPATDGGTIAARYFMPWSCHPTMAVTGAQCVASCALTAGSIADGVALCHQSSPAAIEIEHPSGRIAVTLSFDGSGHELRVISAGLLRTARLLVRGEVYIPRELFGPPNNNRTDAFDHVDQAHYNTAGKTQ